MEYNRIKEVIIEKNPFKNGTITLSYKVLGVVIIFLILGVYLLTSSVGGHNKAKIRQLTKENKKIDKQFKEVMHKNTELNKLLLLKDDTLLILDKQVVKLNEIKDSNEITIERLKKKKDEVFNAPKLLNANDVAVEFENRLPR